jgi:3-oxoacyl-(acyl-carrier-protein) synthase
MYINGIGVISPQRTHTGDFSCEQAANRILLSCLEPDYKTYIDPRLSRRMSRVVKMGTTAALIALQDAHARLPAAIVTGSGFGCMSDTEKFLGSITETAEKFLNPAPFIHSTHNTISSQIAMLLGCTGYNQTFVQGPFSFESALLDGTLLLSEGSDTVLVGGVDEMTPDLLQITRRFGHWKKQPLPNSDLLFANSKGTLAGEGAAFFLLSREKSLRSYGRILDVGLNYGSITVTELESWILRFLESNRMIPGEVDLCLFGKNGDKRYDGIYNGLQTTILQSCTTASYKHLCGEYLTASAFAFALAATILKTGRIPESMLASKPALQPLRNILLFNRYRTDYQSLVLLQACDSPG